MPSLGPSRGSEEKHGKRKKHENYIHPAKSHINPLQRDVCTSTEDPNRADQSST